MKNLILLSTLFFCFAAPSEIRKPKIVSRQIRSEETAPGIQKLRNAIEAALPENKKHLAQGIIVSSMATGEVLFERNSEELLVPASVNKIFTAYAALKKMKPTATFKTQLYTTGVLRDGKLGGDLYVKGGGDPSLVSERMWMMVNEFRRSGIKTITGNIIVDSSYFDEEKTPDSRPKYLKDQAYNAPVGALSFNFNTTTVYVRPGEQVGQPPTVYTDPANSYIDIVNQAKTGPAGGSNSVAANRTEYVKGDIGDTVLLRGTIPIDHKELRFFRNIVNPALYAGHMFKTFLDELGIKAMGNILEGKVPSNAKQVLEFESQPMWQVVWGMNKFSNNFVADQILKKLGAEAWGPPGTLQKGVAALQDSLEDIGIPRKNYQISDGSGLTRTTKVTARHILTVLNAAYHDISISSEFMASLGIAGEDGTLKNRFPSSSNHFTLRAKTGTLDGVTALAGYVTSADKETLGFAIILNDPKVKYGRMTGWVDQIALAISKFSRK